MISTSLRNLALAAIVATGLASSANAVALTGLFDTGVDANGVKLAQTAGAADTHWKVNGTGTPVTYNNAAYIQAADADWIAVQSDGGYTNANNDYTLTFDLTGLNPATAAITGRFAADNGATLYLNGTQISTTNTFQSFTSFDITSGFTAGINTLKFSVYDTGKPSALVVSQLQGTAAVPEPATWAMMLVGFAGVGMTLRTKRRSVHFA